LFTSERTDWKKTFRRWIGIAVFCAFFSSVYEYFSHGVYSRSMISLFLYPLLLCALPCMIFQKNPDRAPADPAAWNLWTSGAVTLLFGSLVKGVVEIYGTTTPFSVIYPVLGILLLFAGAAVYLAAVRRRENGTA
jgi:hypothetical protein